MSAWQKVKDELRSLLWAFLYFSAWIGGLMLIKALVLAEYHIAFGDWSVALIGALVLSKVVLILEHVSLGAWVRSRPAWVDVVLRTAMYSLGVLVVLILEKGFEGRHEYGGFVPAVEAMVKEADLAHILVNTICLSGALLVYNVYSVIQQQLGPGGFARLFLTPLPEPESE